jgi:hypothetical protein
VAQISLPSPSSWNQLDVLYKQPYLIVASMVVAGKYAGIGGYDNLTARITSLIGM